jgi:hypothetical protein
MSSFPVLEVAIGLSFTYLLLALITTTITEWITRITNARGQVLVQGISQLLGESGKAGGALTTAIFDHPLIRPLGQQKPGGAQRTPSYIPAPLFSRALADILAGGQQSGVAQIAAAPAATQQLQGALKALQQGPALQNIAGGVALDLTAVEQWYDDHMERVSGWYKRHTQTITLVLAVLITLLTNASTISLAQRLWTDAPLREAVVESAKVRLQQGPPLQTVEYEDPTTPKPTKPILAEDSNANRVMPEEQQLLDRLAGWSGEIENFESDRIWWLVSHLLGWLISAFAISLGAPFWFDTLNKVMSIRSAGRSPQEVAAGK